YIDALSQYHYDVGQIEKGKELLPEPEALKPFAVFCEQAWKTTMDLVDEIHKKQQERAGKKQ
ncbi:MAG: Fic family protein, partial [Desulfobacterales bacterium]|nr:Fic family protein [Desulfobacterales bacterium]